jgi:hypothetical protein
LLEVATEKRLEDFELTTIDTIALQHRADIGGPVNEPEVSPQRGMRPDDVDDVPVPIGGMVAESQFLQSVHFIGDRGDIGSGVHLAEDCVPVFPKMDLVAHAALSRNGPLGVCR